MDELLRFQNEEFGEIRAQEIDGKPWFCLADICRPLGIRTTDCKMRLKQDGVDIIYLADSLGRPHKMLFVNEANLYRAIFQSVKPEAERFTDWVTEEVLPSIRKTGGYQIQPQPQGMMSTAQQLAAQAQLLVQVAETAERSAALSEQTAARLDRALTALSRPAASSWAEDMAESIRGYCAAAGLTELMGRGRLYAALDREAKCSTDARLRCLRERQKKAGVRRRDYMALTKLDAIALDGKLRSAFEGIVARETARAAQEKQRE